jgi:DNA-binding GntR family transcriptional regulator
MPLATEKLVQATLRQQIVKQIRQAILNRSLLPGERLVERELAKQLGTSLTATREALIQLETEGLITKRPNATTHVTQLTPKEVEQIFSVRRVLEKYAFEEAARVADSGEVRRLRDLHVVALEAARSNDGVTYVAADLEWHQAVWQTTKNAFLAESLRRVVLPLFGFSSIEVATRKGFDLEQDAQSHAPLLKAIRAHDPVAAGVAFDKFAQLWMRYTLEASTDEA